jgi:hypothetical protein
MTPFSLRPSTRQSANRGNGAHTSLSSRAGLERAPSQTGSRSGRPPRTRSQSALGTATVPRSGSRLGSAAPRPVLSKEMQELQRRLHRSDGFRTLQDSLLLQEGAAGSGCGEPAPRLQDPAVLAEAIEKATALRPSPALLEEVQLLGTRGGGAWDFSTLADTLWDEEIAQRPPTRALDKGGRPRKHLFLPNVSCGFYNDNVAPASTLFGIKKVLSCCPPRASCRRAALAWPSPADAPRVQGSSSVRYNLFNNEYQRSLYATVKCAPRLRRPRVLDACCLLRLRPLVWPASAPLTCAAAPRGRPELLDAVNRDMKIVPASHPTTSRPLDPVPALSYRIFLGNSPALSYRIFLGNSPARPAARATAGEPPLPLPRATPRTTLAASRAAPARSADAARASAARASNLDPDPRVTPEPAP